MRLWDINIGFVLLSAIAAFCGSLAAQQSDPAALTIEAAKYLPEESVGVIYNWELSPNCEFGGKNGKATFELACSYPTVSRRNRFIQKVPFG